MCLHCNITLLNSFWNRTRMSLKSPQIFIHPNLWPSSSSSSSLCILFKLTYTVQVQARRDEHKRHKQSNMFPNLWPPRAFPLVILQATLVSRLRGRSGGTTSRSCSSFWTQYSSCCGRRTGRFRSCTFTTTRQCFPSGGLVLNGCRVARVCAGFYCPRLVEHQLHWMSLMTQVISGLVCATDQAVGTIMAVDFIFHMKSISYNHNEFEL